MPINTIFGLFAKSPLKPLQKHMDVMDECCHLLAPLWRAACQQAWSEAEEQLEALQQRHLEGSKLKRAIRLRLPHGLFTPLPRNELLDLLDEQERLGALALELAETIMLRRILLPPPLTRDLLHYLDKALEASSLATSVIHELDDLLETGFLGREVSEVGEKVEQLDAMDQTLHALRNQLRQNLLSQEEALGAVNVMFLYQCITFTAELTTQAERIGARLELMLARR